MNELRIGGFKNNESSNQEYDFSNTESKETEITETIVEDTGEPVTNATDITDIDDSDLKSQPIENKTDPVSVTDSSLTPDPVSVTNEVSNETELTKESALEFLSEALGKNITLDDLVKEETISPLETDPYLKKFYEWRQKTGRSIEDFIKYQKDYSSMSDTDVAREFLQHEYPDFTKEEIDLELDNYLSSPDDLDDERKKKKLELKKLAIKGRNVLKELVSDLGEPITTELSPEVRENLELAQQIKEQYLKQQEFQNDYNEGILNSSKSVENLKLNLNDELTLDFKIADNIKEELPNVINTMPHWKNEDGTWNHKEVVNDAIKITQFDKIIKLVYEQGVSTGKESIIEDSQNSTLSQPSPNGATINSGKGIEIEGLDEYLGKGTSLRVRN